MASCSDRAHWRAPREEASLQDADETQRQRSWASFQERLRRMMQEQHVAYQRLAEELMEGAGLGLAPPAAPRPSSEMKPSYSRQYGLHRNGCHPGPLSEVYYDTPRGREIKRFAATVRAFDPRSSLAIDKLNDAIRARWEDVYAWWSEVVDRGGLGSVTQTEFCSEVAEAMQLTSEEAAMIFKCLDTQNTGWVAVTEIGFLDLFQSERPLPGRCIDATVKASLPCSPDKASSGSRLALAAAAEVDEVAAPQPQPSSQSADAAAGAAPAAAPQPMASRLMMLMADDTQENATKDDEWVIQAIRERPEAMKLELLEEEEEEEVDEVVVQSQSSPFSQGQRSDRMSASASFVKRTSLHREKTSTFATMSEEVQKHTNLLSRLEARLKEFEGRHQPKRTDGYAARVEGHRLFELLCASVILGNTVYIVLTTNHDMNASAKGSVDDATVLKTHGNHSLEWTFYLFYLAELSLRIWVHGVNFFINSDAFWNWLDFVLVLASTFEIVITTAGASSVSLMFLRIARLLKISKLLRVVRAVRFLSALRLFLDALRGCIMQLFWASIMLALVLLVFALLFVQVFSNHLQDRGTLATEDMSKDDILERFGTVQHAMIMLFELAIGFGDWYATYQILEKTGYLATNVFMFFTLFVSIAVWNNSVIKRRARRMADERHESA
eukprot:TRINITY_DN7964_c0_g1_i4.p1 TRINITY_DN7964_c0_g1~~TRINITY_DN7964_c0_g1_i4.p1  ORF type:complete len:668 (-),score=147.01 TRINITY_DN7964_c0_g1_i4:156-2159(-)